MPQLGPYTLTVARATRFAHAVGVALNLGRDATQDECDQWVRDQAIALTKNVEKQEALAAVGDPTPLSFT